MLFIHSHGLCVWLLLHIVSCCVLVKKEPSGLEWFGQSRLKWAEGLSILPYPSPALLPTAAAF